jgi:hypothetical protein
MMSLLLANIVKHLRSIFVVSLIVIISACSFKTLYNRLDYLVPSYVEGMVSLDDVLEEKLEQRTNVLLNWHRNTQLKQYADLLRIFQQDLGSPLTEERVLQHMNSMETLWLSLEAKLNQEMADLLPMLDRQQREELFESIEEKNEDFYDDYVDLDEQDRIEQYTDTTLDTYESWLGELTEKQEQAVADAVLRITSNAALRLQQRKLWQQNIRQILESEAGRESKSEQLLLFFDSFKINQQPELAAATEANKEIFASLTADVFQHLTAEQKAYFITRTNKYIAIFTELAENR